MVYRFLYNISQDFGYFYITVLLLLQYELRQACMYNWTVFDPSLSEVTYELW